MPKNLKKTKKKIKGGSEEKIPEFLYDPKKKYGTKNLGIVMKQVWSLHHNKMDIQNIAKLNILTKGPITSIYPKSWKDFFAYFIEKYNLNEGSNEEIKKILDDANGNFLKCPIFWHCDENKVLFVGEYDKVEGENVKTIPIFLNDDDRGFFYDMNGIQYYATHTQRKSKILDGNTVYVFSTKEGNFDKKHLNKIAPSAKKVLQNVDNASINQLDALEASGLYAQDKEYEYLFSRARMSKNQEQCIKTHFLSFKILHDLNYDKSKSKQGYEDKEKYLYRSSERLSFYDCERMKNSINLWFPKKNTTAYISETFEPEVPDKLTYLAGFTKLKMNYNNEKDSNGIHRPIFLYKYGYFKDGNDEYLPSYETITITKQMLEDANLLTSEKETSYGTTEICDHSYLIGKQAYLFNQKFDTFFNLPNETTWACQYNDSFREKTTTQVVLSYVSIFLGTISALEGTAMGVIGTAAGVLTLTTGAVLSAAIIAPLAIITYFTLVRPGNQKNFRQIQTSRLMQNVYADGTIFNPISSDKQKFKGGKRKNKINKTKRKK